MKTRIMSFLVAAALMAGALSGCGAPAPTPTPSRELTPTQAPTMTPDPHEGMVEVPNGDGGTMWITESEVLTPFPADRGSFSLSDGVLRYSGDDLTLRRGIDVSAHQGEIDWRAVAASGIEFAIIRCGWRGYGEAGSLNEDSTFRANIEGAKAAGLKVGAYFFSQATSLAEGAEEAIFALSLLEDYTLDLPVFFDWEFIGVEPARTDDVDGETVTEACLEFCHLLASEGYETGMYAYLNLAYFTYDLDRLADLAFWIGDPGSQPDFYYDHSFWQYSYTGAVPGIEGSVDLDVMYLPAEAGTEAAG